jgi:hypothetical protein
MSILRAHDSHAAWYTGDPALRYVPSDIRVSICSNRLRRNRNVSADAYHEVVKLLKTEIQIDLDAPIPLEKLGSIQDVCAIVEKAKTRYINKSVNQSGARKWLEKLSGRIMHYAPVLDALAQHHPEYVALAWGAIKFVLMVRHAK